MKLRYKKAILLSLFSTLGMGMVTLSISPGHNSIESTNLASNPTPTLQAPEDTGNDNPSPTASATSGSLPVYAFEKDGYDDITKLIKNYYKAKLSCDQEMIKSLLSDPTKVGSPKELKKNIMFIEGYKDIVCHVKKSFRDKEYVVFVSHNIKIYNIKTMAPALDEFYVTKSDSGELKIFSGQFDEQTEQYYHDRIKDSDVAKLIQDIKKKVESARKNDKDFKVFWDNSTKSGSTKKS